MALLRRAIRLKGGRLQEEEDRGPCTIRMTFGDKGLTWKEALVIASEAIGLSMLRETGAVTPTVVTFADIAGARDALAAEAVSVSTILQGHLRDCGPSDEIDRVIDTVKRSPSLTAHEKRLLPCIVEPAKLSGTSFTDVHLPFRTIDGVRTIVSLPLLYPEAFQGGVLKDHTTSGALLFGPPGTGKTLLARAVAKESGARMLSIQASILKAAS